MPESESTCDICGRPIYGKPIYKYVEGAKLEVCLNCSKFGKSIKPPKLSRPKYIKKKKAPYRRKEYRGDIFLVENFGKIIKTTREKRNMTQNKFAQILKEPLSLIKRIEQNRINPSLKVVKKIENLLNITLTEKDVEGYYPKPTKKPKTETTIGDIVQIKKKKE